MGAEDIYIPGLILYELENVIHLLWIVVCAVFPRSDAVQIPGSKGEGEGLGTVVGLLTPGPWGGGWEARGTLERVRGLALKLLLVLDGLNALTGGFIDGHVVITVIRCSVWATGMGKAIATGCGSGLDTLGLGVAR